jgi:DNA-3-methyladenine glycosylase
MNVVTGEEGSASAVLLRAAVMKPSASVSGELDPAVQVLTGPGNLTRGLGFTGEDDGLDVCTGVGGRLHFREGKNRGDDLRVGCSPRIGISRVQERPSRYFLEGHPAVSPRRAPRVKVAT